MPTFEPKTYHDVVKDLAWWAGVLLAILVFAIVPVLPPDLAAGVAQFAERLPFKGFLEPLFVVGVLAVEESGIETFGKGFHQGGDDHVQIERLPPPDNVRVVWAGFRRAIDWRGDLRRAWRCQSRIDGPVARIG